MKFSDAASGVVIALVGIGVVLFARTFPSMPGQSVGPALFPTLIGVGLALVGLALLVSGQRQGAPWLQPGEWMRRPRMVRNFALVVAVLVFYAMAVNRLGFFITALAFLVALFAAFGVTRKWILPLAVLVTLAIHYGFYTLLRVPLPWGLLESMAW